MMSKVQILLVLHTCSSEVVEMQSFLLSVCKTDA